MGEVRKDLDPSIVAWFYVGGYFTLILMTEMNADEVEDPDFMDKYLNILHMEETERPLEAVAEELGTEYEEGLYAALKAAGQIHQAGPGGKSLA
jgi:hypothetical protein